MAYRTIQETTRAKKMSIKVVIDPLYLVISAGM
jgi:hypothetical protein